MDGSAEPEFKSFAKGRKTYKTIRGEPIWPPHLEAALFEGLQRYEPVQSRETLLLGRFPYRNQFLSDYIFQKTGSRRTQKQVGSRIQVLKESPDGRRLLQKFNLKHHDSKKWNRDAMSSPSPDPCNTACGTEDIVSPAGLTYPVYASSSHSSLSCSPSEVTVFIDFIPEFIPPSSSWQPSTCKSRGSPSPPLFTGLDLLGVGCAPPSVRLDSGIEGSAIFCPSRNPRLLRAIDPTVSFVSGSTITARSICAVYMDGVCIHTDETPLRLGAFKLPVESSCDQRLYSVALVPEYWDDICRSEDPTRYTILQQVARTEDPGAWPECMNTKTVLFCATYVFRSAGTPAQPEPVKETLGTSCDLNFFMQDSSTQSSDNTDQMVMNLITT